MMHRILLLGFTLTLAGGLIAQHQRTVFYPATSDWQFSLKPTPDAWFVAVSLKVFGGNGNLIDPAKSQLLTPDEHFEAPSQSAYAPMYLDALASNLNLQWEGAALPDSVIVDAYYPLRQPEPTPRQQSAERACACPIPAYLTKNDWCTLPGQCAPVTAPFSTQVTHLIVHHSAGPNTASSWPAVVNSIWNYHVNTNGWADIGYNWLIAPDGTLFQGRGDNVIGAHFCSQNSNTMGVCMIGTYSDVNITPAARQTLVQLLAWKSCERNIDPDNVNYHAGTQLILPVVSGHRDGCATECPGGTFHAGFDALRLSVAAFADLCQASHVNNVQNQDTTVRCAQGWVQVQLPENVELPAEMVIVDMLGQVVETERINTTSAQLPLLPSTGISFYSLQAGKQRWVGKCSLQP